MMEVEEEPDDTQSNAALVAGLAVFDSCAGLVPATVWKKRFPNTIGACGRDQNQQPIRAVKRVCCEEMTAEKHSGQTK